VQNPSLSGHANFPSWTLTAISTNKQNIRTDDQSNGIYCLDDTIPVSRSIEQVSIPLTSTAIVRNLT
jgi:hypothetical protein